MPHDADGFARPADLTDPKELAEKCESLAGGMAQQANASRQGTALGGHPFPSQLFNETAVVLKACVEMCKHVSESVPHRIPATPVIPSKAPATAPKG